jgi:prevent-host-death family protein
MYALALIAFSGRPDRPEDERQFPDLSASATMEKGAVDLGGACGHNDYMARNLVGARELKTRLGTYLRRVRAGRTLVVTDRGEPIAEIRPLTPDGSVSPELLRLSAKGTVTLPTRTSLSDFRPIRSRGGTISDAIREDREDRF